MNDFSSVEGKVAVITGAASGMGKAIAEILLPMACLLSLWI